MRFQRFHDGQELSLSCRVARLRVVKLSTVESDWLAILRDDSAELIMTSVRVYGERLAEVRKGKDGFLGDYALCHGKGLSFFGTPLPFDRLGREAC